MQSWETIEEVPEGDYRVFSVRRRRARSPRSGQTHDFYVLHAPDWVNVVPVTPEGTVICVEQYRPGTDEVTLEIPGGVMDPGETPETAARRELLEETGYTAEQFIPLGTVDPNPAIQSNSCQTFLAAGVRQEQAPAPDEAEEIRIEHVSLTQIGTLVRTGRIRHALVVVAFHLLDQYVEAHPDAASPWRSGVPSDAAEESVERKGNGTSER